MSADIFDLQTRQQWTQQQLSRFERMQVRGAADCTAPFFDLIFLETSEAELNGSACTDNARRC
ncbi:MAG: hypothetical protein NW206_12520 [Hyphomonadaceae bacterium]|nr:hypothetical protein [Hyphomonadaceae bacterium]